MPRLDDANVADEYGPDRFMPREVAEGEGTASPPSLTTSVVRADFAGRFGDARLAVRFARFDAWLRQHDAEVAAKALDAWAAELASRCEGYFNPGACETCSQREDVEAEAARIRAEAQL